MSTPHTDERSHWPLVALSVVPALLGVLLPLILVRVISPAEVGIFKIFFLYLGLAPTLFLTSGIRSGLAYWAGRESERQTAMQVSSSVLLIIALIATVLALLLNSAVAAQLSVPHREASLFALSLIGAIAGSFFEEAAIAVGRIWTGALFSFCTEVVRSLVIVAALLLGHTLSTILVVHTLVSIIKVMISYGYGYRLGLVNFSLSPQVLKGVWRYAFPVSLAYVFGVLINSADQILLAHLISPQEFALYSIGCLTVAPLLTFEQSVTRVLIPQMSEAFALQQKERAVALYRSAVDHLAFILIPAVFGIILFATPIIELLFTPRYSAAANYLRVFGLTYLLLIIPHDALARSRGEARWILSTFMIFATISLGVCSALIYCIGPMGALCGILCSGTCMRWYSMQHFKNALSIRIHNFIPLEACKRYALVCICLSGLALLLKPCFATNFSWFIGGGGAFCLAYLGLAWPIKNRMRRKMEGAHNILLMTQSLNVGGLERMLLNLSRQLHLAHQCSVRVFAYDHGGENNSLLDTFKGEGIPVDVYKKGDGFSFWIVIKLIASIRSHNISIVHSQDLGTLIYAVIAKSFSFGRISVVHTQHSFPSNEEDLRHRIYRRIFTMGIDHLVVVSDDVGAAYSVIWSKPSRMHLIANGVEFARAQILEREQKIALRQELICGLGTQLQSRVVPMLRDLWIIYQGRFSPGKGQDLALRAWGQMSAVARARTVLCLVGPESVAGQYQRIKELMRCAPDSDRILMLGPSEMPLTWLRVGDLFLSCSQYEGMPLAPLEAGGSGLPLVLSDIPGHQFLRTIAALYPLNDPERCADLIEHALNLVASGGESYQRELWERSDSIRTRYSVEQMAKDYAVVYSKTFA